MISRPSRWRSVRWCSVMGGSTVERMFGAPYQTDLAEANICSGGGLDPNTRSWLSGWRTRVRGEPVEAGADTSNVTVAPPEDDEAMVAITTPSPHRAPSRPAL